MIGLEKKTASNLRKKTAVRNVKVSNDIKSIICGGD